MSEMNVKDQNDVFHGVVKEAEQQVEQEEHPKPAQKTERDFQKERVAAAEDIDQNAMDLEKM